MFDVRTFFAQNVNAVVWNWFCELQLFSSVVGLCLLFYVQNNYLNVNSLCKNNNRFSEFNEKKFLLTQK